MNLTASQLYKKISKYDNLVSQEAIKKAYYLSKKAHANQFRGFNFTFNVLYYG